MRIVGGTLSGRKIVPPVSPATRPMMDRVRQALFNILEHHDWGHGDINAVIGAHVLDAFCGTGALAFEALSRGAAHATLFDTDRQALAVARKNAAALGLEKNSDTAASDALKPPRAAKPCTLVFLDPPYRKGMVLPALAALDGKGWIAPRAIIVAATAKKETLEIPEEFNLVTSRFYGDTALHFIMRTTTAQ